MSFRTILRALPTQGQGPPVESTGGGEAVVHDAIVGASGGVVRLEDVQQARNANNLRAKNCRDADALIRPTYRKGYSL
jgi:hypothetical protein